MMPRQRSPHITETQLIAMFTQRKGGEVFSQRMFSELHEVYLKRPDLIEYQRPDYGHSQKAIRASGWGRFYLTPLGRSFLKLKCGAKV